MSIDTFRAALGSKLGQIVTPEMCAWLEENAFDRVDKSHPVQLFGVDRFKEVVFSVEKIADISDELHGLHVAHWQETERHQSEKVNPDYQRYVAYERAGQLVQFTARQAGKLVGHVRMYVFNSMHTQKLESKEDAFYMLPEARRGFAAIRFWQFVERGMKKLGVTAITTDTKVQTKNVGRLNEYLGYKHVADVYYKSLSE